MDRRDIVAGGMAALALPQKLFADNLMPDGGRVESDPKDVILLWPGDPPGSQRGVLQNRIFNREPGAAPIDRYIDQVGTPQMMVFRPDRADGSALLIAPGGGYAREMVDFEGTVIARRFNQAGVTCFVLTYRLPAQGWSDAADVPLQDAQRAVRLVKLNAAKYGIDAARLGFMGFSAGGHVAASIATRFGARVYSPVDAADQLEARPSFSVLMYPVVTMGEGAHLGSRDNLLGSHPTSEMILAYSCERNVPADAPPTFLCLAADDDVVPPLANGLAMFVALRNARIASEIHIFEEGGHGFAISKTVGKPNAVWPELVLRWGASHGLFANI